MFHKIPFSMCSVHDIPNQNVYADDENFLPPGSSVTFIKPPSTKYALENLYYMEDFFLVHWNPGAFTMQNSRQDTYMILYTYEGEGTVDYLDKNYTLTKGKGIFLDCSLPYSYVADIFWKYSILYINGRQMKECYKEYCKNGSPVFTSSPDGTYQKSLEQLLVLYNSAQPHLDWMVSDCITQMLTALLQTSYEQNRKYTTTPENILLTKKYMEKHFETDLSLDFLSEFSGVSKYHLSREFKKHIGFSPREYLIQLRIQKAKSLLSTTDLPVNKIAHTVGIHDINNFNMLFKKHVDMTPGQFRASHRNQFV